MRNINAARAWDFAAAGMAGGLALSELVRLAILGGVSNAQTTVMTIIGSSAFVAVLAVAAVGIALHRQVGWIFGLLAVLTATSHGILLATTGSAIGAVYVGGSMALFAFVVKSLHWYRSEAQNEIVAT